MPPGESVSSRYKAFLKSASSDITSGHVHLDVTDRCVGISTTLFIFILNLSRNARSQSFVL